MFAAGKTAAVSGETPDAQFNYVTMLLHGDGTNGAQNNTFLDSSTNNFTITRNGNTTQGSFSPYGSNWSNYFGGTGNYLTTATSTSAFSFGTGDFTIEFWINSTQTTRCDPIGQNNTFSSSGWWGLIANLSSSGQLQWFENTTSRISATATNWNNGSWNHIAVTRSGNSVRMFVNGTQVGSTYTTSFTYGASSVGVIAGVLSDDKTTGPLTGYLSNFRIVKGTALYTGTFTPSTTPLTAVSGTSLLTCQANRFFDASTSALTITTTGTPSVQRFNPFGASTAYSTSVIGGSGYFDGSGDYVSTPNNSAFDISSGNFTMEAWVYYTSRPSSNVMSINSGSGVSGIYFMHGSDPAVYITSNGSSWDIMAQPFGAYLKLNCWNHVALVRNGNDWNVYINGVSEWGITNSSSISINSTVASVGASGGGGQPTFGYICDARIVKGTAVYTSNFTPPTAPLTAVSGTSLLLGMKNGAIFDNAMMNDLETVGNAQISTSVKKYGTGSIYFDGTGDTLKITPDVNVNMNFGTGPFTFECWVYRSSASGQIFIADFGVSSVNGWALYDEGSGGNMQFRIADVDRIAVSPIPATTWTHLAVVRVGTTVTLYVNGTSAGSYASAGTDLIYAGTKYIGSQSGSSSFMNGYIDDLRITKGYARYTATFTPPTKALSDTGPI